MLDYADGNKSEAAKKLDIGLATLYRKLKEYGLD
jgi:transcriptional regulator of acetoin/glycerol metabolism